MTHFYRYEDVAYASFPDDYEGRASPGRLEVRLSHFKVIKATPCGVQLDIGRFVKTSGRKRFAWPTKAEALESFKARKQRQLGILRAQASRAERALAMAASLESYSQDGNQSFPTTPSLPGVRP